MFEAGRHEGSDGEDYREHLVDQGLACHRQPHRKADQDVAQDSPHEDHLERQGCLGRRNRQRRDPHLAATELPTPREPDHQHDGDGTHEVAGEHDGPVAQQLRDGDVSVDQAHHHEVVPGEELGASDDDQDQPERERQSCKPSGGTEPELGPGPHDRRQHGTEGDEGAREDAEDEGREERPSCLGDSFGLDHSSDLGRGVGLDPTHRRDAFRLTHRYRPLVKLTRS